MIKEGFGPLFLQLLCNLFLAGYRLQDFKKCEILGKMWNIVAKIKNRLFYTNIKITSKKRLITGVFVFYLDLRCIFCATLFSAANMAATFCCASSILRLVRWVYMSMVMLMEECPTIDIVI